LRCGERDRVQIEIAPAQVGEAGGEIGCRIPRLEIGRCEIAQHGIISRTVGVVEGEQGRADQVENPVDAGQRGLLRRLGRGRHRPSVPISPARSGEQNRTPRLGACIARQRGEQQHHRRRGAPKSQAQGQGRFNFTGN